VDPLTAMAEPTRRRLLDLIGTREATVSQLMAASGASQPTVSKHLRVLREAGLVTARVDGPQRWYRVEAEPLRAVADWLETFRPLWTERLDGLQSHLDAHP
jgi:DNA-binding transcriptional ArsR family regulator